MLLILFLNLLLLGHFPPSVDLKYFLKKQDVSESGFISVEK
jgi:hypothetical protein